MPHWPAAQTSAQGRARIEALLLRAYMRTERSVRFSRVRSCIERTCGHLVGLAALPLHRSVRSRPAWVEACMPAKRPGLAQARRLPRNTYLGKIPPRDPLSHILLSHTLVRQALHVA